MHPLKDMRHVTGLRGADVGARRIMVVLYLSTMMILSGCSGPKDRDNPKTASSEAEEQAATEPSVADAAPSAEATEDDEDAWSVAVVRSALVDDGWTLDEVKPDTTEVATPEGTQIDGWTAQRGSLRADIVVYAYPREGYARAHARAQGSLERTAMVQYGRHVIAVIGRDRAHAQEVLDALPHAYTQKSNEAP